MKKIFPNQSLIYHFSSILVVFFPASLIAGPFVSELFMNISSILILYLIIKEKKYYYFQNKVFYFFVFYCFYLLMRSFFSQDPLLSFEVSIFYFRYGLFVITILYLIENEKKFIKIFFLVFFITFLILVFDGYFQFFSGQNIFGFQSERPDRIGGLFFDELKLGSFIVKLFPLLCVAFFYLKQKKIKNLFLMFLILSYFMVLLSGERAAFILINFFVVLSCFGLMKLKRFIIYSLTFILLMTLLIWNTDSLKNRHYDQFLLHLVNKTPNGETVFFPEYAMLFKISQNMFLDNVLFGQGPKTYRALCFKKKYRKNLDKVAFRKGKDVFLEKHKYTACTTHTHNYYLQIFSETGLVGAFFVLYFYINVLRKYFFSIRNRHRINVLISSGLIVNLWPLTTTGSFFNNWISMTLYILIAFYLYFFKYEN